MSELELEQRMNIIFLVKLGKNGSEIREKLEQVYRDNAMKKTAAYKISMAYRVFNAAKKNPFHMTAFKKLKVSGFGLSAIYVENDYLEKQRCQISNTLTRHEKEVKFDMLTIP
jgi:hypothetical protein